MDCLISRLAHNLLSELTEFLLTPDEEIYEIHENNKFPYLRNVIEFTPSYLYLEFCDVPFGSVRQDCSL